MGMSYLTSLNTQLFKNIAYVGSFGHILFNLIFNVNSNLAESSANCSGLLVAKMLDDEIWSYFISSDPGLFEDTEYVGSLLKARCICFCCQFVGGLFVTGKT